MINSRITSHSVLSPYGSMSITLVAIPAGMPAVPRCRPTVFYKPRREKAPSGLVYVVFLFGYSCLNSLFVQVLFYKNGSSQAGTTARWYSPGANDDIRARTNVILDLSVGDYIEAYIYQNEGGAINASNSETFFRGYKLIGV